MSIPEKNVIIEDCDVDESSCDSCGVHYMSEEDTFIPSDKNEVNYNERYVPDEENYVPKVELVDDNYIPPQDQFVILSDQEYNEKRVKELEKEIFSLHNKNEFLTNMREINSKEIERLQNLLTTIKESKDAQDKVFDKYLSSYSTEVKNLRALLAETQNSKVTDGKFEQLEAKYNQAIASYKKLSSQYDILSSEKQKVDKELEVSRNMNQEYENTLNAYASRYRATNVPKQAPQTRPAPQARPAPQVAPTNYSMNCSNPTSANENDIMAILKNLGINLDGTSNKAPAQPQTSNPIDNNSDIMRLFKQFGGDFVQKNTPSTNDRVNVAQKKPCQHQTNEAPKCPQATAPKQYAYSPYYGEYETPVSNPFHLYPAQGVNPQKTQFRPEDMEKKCSFNSYGQW